MYLIGLTSTPVKIYDSAPNRGFFSKNQPRTSVILQNQGNTDIRLRIGNPVDAPCTVYFALRD